jgi:glycosyltransferase involved in cell wall biosynthesis
VNEFGRDSIVNVSRVDILCDLDIKFFVPSPTSMMRTVVSMFGVEPNRIGGTETFARELSVQLGKKGYKSVLCFETPPPPDVARFLDLPNVEIVILSNPTNFNWSATKRFIQIINKYNPEILHLHFIGFIGLFPWLGRILAVKKIFFTDHSSRPEGYEPTSAPFIKRCLVRLINFPLTKVICVSEFGLRCMRTLNVLPADRYELVYNAVDVSRVSADRARGAEFRKRYSIPNDKNLIAQISWIIPDKGIPDLIEVARLLNDARPDIHFVIVGEGPYREKYMRDANELGLTNITWTGLMKDPFEEGVFDAADIVCQLSRWEELFGWMIAEAMAFGKPVIATRVGGIPELIVNDGPGLLVERGNSNEVAEKITNLLANPELTRSMGQRGQEAVAKHFNLSTNVRQLLGSYGL